MKSIHFAFGWTILAFIVWIKSHCELNPDWSITVYPYEPFAFPLFILLCGILIVLGEIGDRIKK